MEIIGGKHLIDEMGMRYFQDASVFGALSPAALEFLLTGGRVLRLDAGEVLYEPGDRGDRFYVVLAGTLSYFQSHEGELAHIRKLGFGEEIGFCAMIALHARIGRPVAAENSLLLEVTSELFFDLHERYPTEFGLFLLNLSREMARTLRGVTDLVAGYRLALRRPE